MSPATPAGRRSYFHPDVSVPDSRDSVAVFGAAGGAVVEVELDLAVTGELGEVALCGGAADANLLGDLGGGHVAGRGLEQLSDPGHCRPGLALGQRGGAAQEAKERVDVVLLGLVDAF